MRDITHLHATRRLYIISPSKLLETRPGTDYLIDITRCITENIDFHQQNLRLMYIYGSDKKALYIFKCFLPCDTMKYKRMVVNLVYTSPFIPTRNIKTIPRNYINMILRWFHEYIVGVCFRKKVPKSDLVKVLNQESYKVFLNVNQLIGASLENSDDCMHCEYFTCCEHNSAHRQKVSRYVDYHDGIAMYDPEMLREGKLLYIYAFDYNNNGSLVVRKRDFKQLI